jgi:ubiquinone/menaquinone biosynthesis C-methylase UbiE
VLGSFGIGTGQTVVEIGSGTRFYSVEAARRVGASGRLVCLDLQQWMLERTRARLTAARLRAHLIQGDALALPLRSGSVDHVFLVTVLGEIPDRAAALAETKRILRPGGHLSAAEQLPDPDFVTLGSLRRELRAAGFVEEQTRGWLCYTSTWRTV